jgi:hypothetical protein
MLSGKVDDGLSLGRRRIRVIDGDTLAGHQSLGDLALLAFLTSLPVPHQILAHVHVGSSEVATIERRLARPLKPNE